MFLDPLLQADPVNRTFLLGTIRTLSFGGDMVFADIEEELRNQYNIGYTPDKLGESGEYRKIHLTAKTNKKKDLVVQTRAGYRCSRRFSGVVFQYSRLDDARSRSL
jgi:hypothetical protein